MLYNNVDVDNIYKQVLYLHYKKSLIIIIIIIYLVKCEYVDIFKSKVTFVGYFFRFW